MRSQLVRLGVAASCAVAALALLGLTVLSVQAGRAPHGRIGGSAPAGAELDLGAPSGSGSEVFISEHLAPISARRTISDPGLNTPITLSAGGRKIIVTGHVACMKGDQYKIQASVTQRSTGALARGETSGACTGKQEQFSASTWVYDEALFSTGPAQVCALLTIRTNGKVADAFQWCRKEDATLTTASATY